jgi:hypothetical protein
MVDKDKVLDCLKELSDIEFQLRAWCAGGGREVSSFPELVSQLFDDTGLGAALERGGSTFGVEVDSLLLRIQRLVASIDQAMPASALIEHPEMQQIRALAAAAVGHLARPSDSF